MRIFWVFRAHLDRSSNAGARLALADQCRAQGVEMFLVSGHKGQPKPDPRVIWLKGVKIPVLNHIFQSLSMITILSKRLRPGDVVMCCPYMAAGCGLLALFKKRNRFVLDVRTLPVKRERLLFWLDRIWFNLGLAVARAVFSAATVITPSMREHLSSRLRGLKTGVWSSWVDLRLFDPSRYSRTEVRKKLGISDGATVFVYWGSLDNPDRGVEQAVKAFSRASNDNSLFLIVGRGNLVEKLKKDPVPRVVVMDPVPQDQVPEILAAGDIAVIPFKPSDVIQTSLPIKLLEAMAMNLPVLGTQTRPLEDVLGHNPGWIRLRGLKDMSEAFANPTVPELNGELRAGVLAYSLQNQCQAMLEFIREVAGE